MTSAEFKCIRESLGLSTRWLADRWGVSHLSVQRWERNRAIPPELESDLMGIRGHFRSLVRSGADRCDGSIAVPRTDVECRGEYPAAFYRAVGLAVADLTSGEIVFSTDCFEDGD